MLTAIGIAGSPRGTGNSVALLDAVLQGARMAGATAELIHLNELRFRGCQGCTRCAPGGQCTVRDALTPVLSALRLADIWVLASPIYFDGVSGQMKLFFDRLHCFMMEDGERKPRLEGARRAAIIVTSEAEPYDSYQTAVRSLAGYFSWMGDFGEVETVCEGGLGPVGAVAQRPDLVDAAKALGRRLVEGLRASS